MVLLPMVLLFTLSTVSSVVVYITPTVPKVPCPGLASDLCMQLSDYSLFSKKENNTELVFLPGEHALTSLVKFDRLVNFSLTGILSTLESSVVKCYNENGGITFDLNSNLLIKNITFSGCQEQKYQMISFVNTHNGSIINSKFSGNIRKGAISLDTCSDITVSNTYFTGNRNEDNGGAMSITQSNIQIIDCVLANNRAKSNGGAIFIRNSRVYIQNSYLMNNTATYGGALLVDNGVLSIVGSNFNGNEAAKYGGTLYYRHFSAGNQYSSYTLDVKNSSFINNKAISGAAIILYGGKTLILNSSFSNNTVSDTGGALYTFQAVLDIASSIFYKNAGISQDITYGGAMFVDQQSTILLKQSQFLHNRVHGYGGAIATSTETTLTAIDTYFEKNENLIDSDDDVGGGALSLSGDTYIFINCSFVDNTAVKGGAIFNYFAKRIYIKLCSFRGNTAWRLGGALLTCKLCFTQLDDSQFIGNTAEFGGAIHAQGSRINSSGVLTFTNNSGLGVVYFHNCVVYFYSELLFFNNRGSLFAFSTAIKFFNKTVFVHNQEPQFPMSEEGGAITLIYSDIFIGGYFMLLHNKARFGGAMYLSNTEVLAALTARIEISENVALVSGAALYCIQTKLSLFAQIELARNNATLNGGGIMAKGSTIIVLANQLRLAQNRAKYGGGIYLQGISELIVHKNVPQTYAHNFFEFSGNTADWGGAIFIKDDINSGICGSNSRTDGQANCFFQVIRVYSLPHSASSSYSLLSAAFTNNTARLGGSSIYGGLMDRCSHSIFSEFLSLYPGLNNSVSILNIIAQLESISSISSAPVRVCFCTNKTLICNQPDNVTISVKRGQSFKISLAAVDQVLKPVVAVILVSVSSAAGLDEGQTKQSIPATCSEVEYNIYSPSSKEELILYAQGPCGSQGISRSKVVVQFEPCSCAIGFQPRNSSSTCECVCDNRLNPFITNCTSNQTLNKLRDLWVSFTNETSPTGFLIYEHCPYDYCLSTSRGPVAIDLNLPSGADTQCAFNRSGKLCGSCAPGYSQTLGGSRCLKCTNSYLALLTVFAMAGVTLVFLLLVLNMTVAVGTINGLVFYANIVIANRSLFLPNETPAILSVFIAWLNLDLGIETCFYNGMDMYTKSLLQLAFPSYVLLLVVLIIVVSKYSRRFSALVGKRNPVATLATLILLSFTKYLRILITTLSFGRLKLPDGTSDTIWLPDGSVDFLATTCILPFIVVAVIITAGIGFILILLFEQRCRKYTEWRPIKCFNNPKLHGFMDAYYAPYSPQHSYWVGLLLLIRTLLFVLIAVALNSNPQLQRNATLMVVIATVFFLLLLKQLKVRVFKNWIINLMETSFLVNLGILADGTYHNLAMETKGRESAQLVLASVSVSVALITFFATCCYHLYAFAIPNSWAKYLERSASKLLLCCQLRRDMPRQVAPIMLHDNMPYVTLEDTGEERDRCRERRVSGRDSALREPYLDDLAPLTSHDWNIVERQVPAQQPARPNIVTYSIV